KIYICIVCCYCVSALSTAHEENPEFWNDSAEQTLRSKYAQMKPQAKPAKNVILFIGDGMGLSTITAGRILKGQLNGQAGEETITALDKFTETGLSKVYCVDKQSPDSGSTATAILSGVKTKFGVVGLDGRTVFKKCSSAAGNEVESILLKSANLGKSTGIVTTTEVQHATPAAAYAHSASRGWYADNSMNSTTKSEGCKDISLQLLEMGRKINVILGGGRSYMRPKGIYDEEYYSRHAGVRGDGRDLIREWRNLQPSNRARYVWNRPGFNSVNAQNTDYLMGLFQPRDLRFDYDRRRDVGGEPSLEEMTEKAIQILQKNPMGYFLLVEGGKIDHAHHQNKANVALREFIAFEKAVQKAMDMTSTDETLIVVTADHGHVFTLGGYANRGNPIHGFARDHSDPEKAVDKLHYTSIAYANGPGYSLDSTTGKRTELTGETTRAMGYRFQTAIPLKGESHSSEDTIVFARGPMSQLFSGVYEQNYIAHAMMFASCVGK
uniref:alkaline phosphatase n=1 Tax=Ciona savignyi TaxID=51511 RepID=H2ZEB1_CIOSA